MTDSPKHDQTENFFDNKKLKLASYLYENTKFASNYNFLSQAETLKQLILYAKRKPNLYYDINGFQFFLKPTIKNFRFLLFLTFSNFFYLFLPFSNFFYFF